MKIVSPYGKDVIQELKTVYRLESTDELIDRVRYFLAESYAFNSVDIEQVHVAFGIAVRFSYKQQRYFLKFTGRANHRQPEALFHFHNYMRRRGIPLPEVLQTVDHTYFENILDGSPYDVTYVMKAAAGQVMQRKTPLRLKQYIEVTANFHRLGASYTPRINSGYRDIHTFLREATEELTHSSYLSSERQDLLARTTAYTENVFSNLENSNELSKTHIHGDFRLCHVLFSKQGVSGIIDAEHATHAERLYDLCTGLVSHPNPARCLFLELNEIFELLHLYNHLYPLTQPDRQNLKAMLLMTLLNELAGASLFQGTGQSESEPRDVERAWRTLSYLDAVSNDTLLERL